MKTAKTFLAILGFAAAAAALILHFYNPFSSPPWRLERAASNNRATVHIVNITQTSLGSGVVISQNGVVLTAMHMANPGDLLFVITHENAKPAYHLASVGIADKQSQLAILFTRDALPPPARIGRTNSLQIGDFIYSIGFPGNMARTVTSFGIVSQKFFFPPQKPRRRAILVDLDPVPGMSGSPVFNSRGELVGIFEAATGQMTMGGIRRWGVMNSIDPLSSIIRKQLAASGLPVPETVR
ncbi:trypsin-like peptidase domain-containing protein [Candidatus Uhrbacteria bacterium]|nr:trypsin-like peptidase domain-containing protein [Candidatus Uhrbacteria bacterium]